MNQIPNLLRFDIRILQQSIDPSIHRNYRIEYAGMRIGIKLQQDSFLSHSAPGVGLRITFTVLGYTDILAARRYLGYQG
jgi:hypothetical protein